MNTSAYPKAIKFSRLKFLEVLSLIRQIYLRSPSPRYLFTKYLLSNNQEQGQKSSPISAAAANIDQKRLDREKILRDLRSDGIVLLDGAVSGEELVAIKDDLNNLVIELSALENKGNLDPDGYNEEYYSEQEDAFLSNNPFKRSKTLLKIALADQLNAIIRAYFRKPVHIQQASLKRMHPHVPDSTGSNQWHHDCLGKRLHIMLLLTDVDESDQYMTYIEGSHRRFHPYAKYVNSRFTQQEVDNLYPRAKLRKATGKAGDIYLFDTNGIHRGNRSLGKIRETCLVCYSPDPSYVWRLGKPEQFLKECPDLETQPIEKMARSSEEESIFPKYRSWTISLPHISSWLY